MYVNSYYHFEVIPYLFQHFFHLYFFFYKDYWWSYPLFGAIGCSNSLSILRQEWFWYKLKWISVEEPSQRRFTFVGLNVHQTKVASSFIKSTQFQSLEKEKEKKVLQTFFFFLMTMHKFYQVPFSCNYYCMWMNSDLIC